MTSHPNTSPPEPLTADDVRYVRKLFAKLAKGSLGLSEEDRRFVTTYVGAMERHAEAMAESIGCEQVNNVPRSVALTFAEYRTAFPRPRAEKDATHG